MNSVFSAPHYFVAAVLGLGAATACLPAQAQNAKSTPAQTMSCPVSHDELVKVLKSSVKASGGPDNGGLPVNEWAVVTTRPGIVCAVAFSGDKPTDQWLGSRGIAEEKANTAVDFSLDDYAVSTANLWAATRPPHGSLYGLDQSNPIVPEALYAGKVATYGTESDPLIGKRVGGVMVFGGGLALYKDHKLIGGLGASGNTSCADHNIAWRVREKLGFDKVPNGPSPQHNDEIIYDVGPKGKSASGWGHPTCGRTAPAIAKQINSGIIKLVAEMHGAPPDAR
jgi:uncharacterized protein GlcG (DUF336 family)